MALPKKGVAFSFKLGLVDSANRPQFKFNPTITSSDFFISKDDSTYAFLASVPTVIPAGGNTIKISLNAAEMNADDIVILCLDTVGGEWDQAIITIKTDVANEIADAYLDRNMAVGIDSGTETFRTPRQALRALRNKTSTVTGKVKKEDDVTDSWSFATTVDAAAVPITEIDPTS